MAQVDWLNGQHTRLLAVQLSAVVDELTEHGRGEAASEELAAAWERFCSLDAVALRGALEDPATHDWLSRARALLDSPVLRSCGRHHLDRLMLRFPVLLMNVAHLDSRLASGRLTLLGSGVVPAYGGTVWLRPPTARRTEIRWKLEERLRVEDARGRLLLELSEDDGSWLGGAAEGWSWEFASEVRGMALFRRPPCVAHDFARDCADSGQQLRSSLATLPSPTRRVLRRCFRAAGPSCREHPFDAWSWLVLEEAPGSRHLTESLAASLVGRCGEVYRFGGGGELATQVGLEPDALRQVIADELESGTALAAESTLSQAIGVCRSPAAGRRRPAARDRGGLDYSMAMSRAGVGSIGGDRQVHEKTRRLDQSPSWRFLDLLLQVPHERLGRLRDALDVEKEGEVRRFGLACLDYHEGRFEDGLRHAVACVELDEVCEDYWLLAAFFARHLGQHGRFEDIVFGGERSPRLLAELRQGSGEER